jgi:hypothetical protein
MGRIKTLGISPSEATSISTTEATDYYRCPKCGHMWYPSEGWAGGRSSKEEHSKSIHKSHKQKPITPAEWRKREIKRLLTKIKK